MLEGHAQHEVHDTYCTVWYSQGARVMSLFCIFKSLRKMSLRRDLNIQKRVLILLLNSSTQDNTTHRHNNYTQPQMYVQDVHTYIQTDKLVQ